MAYLVADERIEAAERDGDGAAVTGPSFGLRDPRPMPSLGNATRHLLVLRFVLVNLVALALLGAAHLHGYVALVLTSDQTYLCAAIVVVFLAGLGLCGSQVAWTSRELDRAKAADPRLPSRAGRYLEQVRGRGAQGRAITAAALRLKLSSRIGVVRQVANSLVLMGLRSAP
jgi:hypothetical protein